MKSSRHNQTPRWRRRDFLKTATLAGGAVVFGVPTLLRAGNLNSKLNIAAIGAGGKGVIDTDCCSGENIVALCDVDSVNCAKQVQKYPSAKFYRDFRVMFDEMGKGIDAVTVSTPDHFHAIAESHAMRLGKACLRPETADADHLRGALPARSGAANGRRHANGQSRQRGGWIAPGRRMYSGRNHRAGERGPHLDEPPHLASRHGAAGWFRPGSGHLGLGRLARPGPGAAV